MALAGCMPVSPEKSQSSFHRSYPPNQRSSETHCTPRLDLRLAHLRTAIHRDVVSLRRPVNDDGALVKEPANSHHRISAGGEREFLTGQCQQERTFPLSKASIAARSSWSRFTRSASRVKRAPLSAAEIPLQSPSNAALATSTARSTSLSEAASTSMILFPVLVQCKLDSRAETAPANKQVGELTWGL